ncbi:MAG: YceI family protein [Acidimicrobiia bacterium]|nr:YceI family protein [Acidimicrobiia bacterium]
MNRKYLAFGGAAGLALVVFAVWFLIFRDTAPEVVSLDSAVGVVTTTAAGDSATTTTAVPAGALDGIWVVDTAIGAGVVEDSSFVGYRVQEELANIGAKTAVGRTTALFGTLEFAGSTLETASITADLTQLASDSRGRDRQIRTQALETNQFPEATFTLTAPVDLGAAPADGQSFTVEAAGDLTIHGVTQPVTITIDGQLIGTTVVVVGRVPITFADYDIDTPRAAVVLSIEGDGEMEFQLFLTKS